MLYANTDVTGRPMVAPTVWERHVFRLHRRTCVCSCPAIPSHEYKKSPRTSDKEVRGKVFMYANRRIQPTYRSGSAACTPTLHFPVSLPNLRFVKLSFAFGKTADLSIIIEGCASESKCLHLLRKMNTCQSGRRPELPERFRRPQPPLPSHQKSSDF